MPFFQKMVEEQITSIKVINKIFTLFYGNNHQNKINLSFQKIISTESILKKIGQLATSEKQIPNIKGLLQWFGEPVLNNFLELVLSSENLDGFLVNEKKYFRYSSISNIASYIFPNSSLKPETRKNSFALFFKGISFKHQKYFDSQSLTTHLEKYNLEDQIKVYEALYDSLDYKDWWKVEQRNEKKVFGYRRYEGLFNNLALDLDTRRLCFNQSLEYIKNSDNFSLLSELLKSDGGLDSDATLEAVQHSLNRLDLQSLFTGLQALEEEDRNHLFPLALKRIATLIIDNQYHFDQCTLAESFNCFSPTHQNQVIERLLCTEADNLDFHKLESIFKKMQISGYTNFLPGGRFENLCSDFIWLLLTRQKNDLYFEKIADLKQACNNIEQKQKGIEAGDNLNSLYRKLILNCLEDNNKSINFFMRHCTKIAENKYMGNGDASDIFNQFIVDWLPEFSNAVEEKEIKETYFPKFGHTFTQDNWHDFFKSVHEAKKQNPLDNLYRDNPTEAMRHARYNELFPLFESVFSKIYLALWQGQHGPKDKKAYYPKCVMDYNGNSYDLTHYESAKNNSDSRSAKAFKLAVKYIHDSDQLDSNQELIKEIYKYTFKKSGLGLFGRSKAVQDSSGKKQWFFFSSSMETALNNGGRIIEQGENSRSGRIISALKSH